MPQFLQLDHLALNRDEAKIIKLARAVSQDVLLPNSQRTDASASLPPENLAALKASGLTNILSSKEDGGKDASFLAMSNVVEVMAKACPSTAAFLVMHYSVFPILKAARPSSGSRAIHREILSGAKLCAASTSEVGAGGRIWHLDGHAAKSGDDYLISARKSFVTGAEFVDYFVTPVRSSPDAGSQDWSLFVVDARSEGVTRKGRWDSLGMRGTGSLPVDFDKVRVPASNQLADETIGFALITAYHLPMYLVGLSSLYYGIALGAYEAVVEATKKRIHTDTNRALSTTEGVQHEVGRMFGMLMLCKEYLNRVCRLSESARVLFDEFRNAGLLNELVKANMDDPYYREILALKVQSCEIAIDVLKIALQVSGGAGYKKGHPVERFFRDVQAGPIMAPASDVGRVILGRQVLGVPHPWQ